MFYLPEPDVILTHESDLDGFVSGLLLQKLCHKIHNKCCELQAWNNEAWSNRRMIESHAWVADLTFEKKIDKPGWVVVDHHRYVDNPTHTELIHSLDKSAGLLCYELCKEMGLSSPILDRLVHLSDVADLFLEDDPDFVEACDYANLIKTYSFWKMYSLVDGDLERLYEHPLLKVMQIKREVEDPIGIEWSKKNLVEITENIAVVDVAVGNSNMVVHQLLKDPQVKYKTLITLFKKFAGSVILSVRSLNGESLQIAQKLRGGGHPNAAGATLPKTVRSVEEGIEYLQAVLKTEPAPKSLNSLEDLFKF